jgi:hypothetical protein
MTSFILRLPDWTGTECRAETFRSCVATGRATGTRICCPAWYFLDLVAMLRAESEVSEGARKLGNKFSYLSPFQVSTCAVW